MEVRNCPLLKGLVSSAPSDDHDDVSNIQLFSKVKFDRLTKLVVGESVEMERNWHQLIPIDLFNGLCELSVSGFKEMKGLFSLPMIQSDGLLQLEKLEISDCEIMKQIILWNEEESQRNIHITPFPKLKILVLDSLPRLTSIVEFSLLEKLEIRNCPVLLESCVSTSISPTGSPHDNDDSIHLFCKPSKVGFGNLKELSIRNYDSMRNWCGQISIDFFVVLCELNISKLKGMKSLFPCSIARNLRNLVVLRISDCEEMVKVIEDEEDDALQISPFPNLKSLSLWYLKKLKCFCEWRCTLQLPKLELLDIEGCDVMDEFTLGALNTPNLKGIYIDGHGSGNEVNKALQQQRRLKRENQYLQGKSAAAQSALVEMEELNFGEESVGSPDRRHCFYDFIWLNNLIELQIPHDFIHDHLASEETDGVILKGPCGSWEAKLEQRDNGLYIVQGWPDFVRNHCLGNKEFVQFLYNGGMSLDVKIFEENGWLKNYQASPEECTPSFTSSFPFFKHEMKGYNVGHKCTIQIPKAFATSIIITSSGHLALSGGWKLFTDAHSIKKGDVCIFELVEEKLMQVHILR
ncbi:hypothetical protein C2S51_003273 [Perilla frutescens var. frutescens]|nr:hypothetical protein C2S51_003273 [Perilla frutescens var. frutescens]